MSDTVTNTRPVYEYQDLLTQTRQQLLPLDAVANAAPMTLLQDLYPGLLAWEKLMREVARVLNNPDPLRGRNPLQAHELDAIRTILRRHYPARRKTMALTPFRNVLMASASLESKPLDVLLNSVNQRRQLTAPRQTHQKTWGNYAVNTYWEDLCNAISLTCMPDVFDDNCLATVVPTGETAFGNFFYHYTTTLRTLTDTLTAIPRLRYLLHTQVDIF